MKNFLLSVLLIVSGFCHAEIKLDRNFQIVFDPSNAIASEKTAAQELKNYLGKIFSAEFKVSQSASVNKIVLGYHKDNQVIFRPEELKMLGEEEFLIRSDQKGNIYIIGGRPRGTLYGVYHFLDNLLGVHWFSSEYEFVPKKKQFVLPDLNLREKPAFSYRKTPSRHNRSRTPDPLWCARNRFNDCAFVPAKMKKETLTPYGGGVYYAPPHPCHTMPLLFPPGKLIKEHPEWLAVKQGKREYHTKIQYIGYCLSNKELLNATIEKVKANLRAYPEAKYMSVSEGDGSGVCECQKCQKIIADHGGKNSALWLHFLNQVADAVREEFPDKLIGTLAYTHTADAPENMTARDNVLIWLCAWGHWRGLPYKDSRNDRGTEFMQTLQKWKKICKNVHIWDYMSTYDNVFRPMPDLRNNFINVKHYREAGVDGIYVQGVSLTFESGAPFKYWAQARCAWNPEQNYEELLKTFCDEYYGKNAGKYIYEYWLHMEKVNRKAGFYKINLSGWEGVAPHAARSNILYADSLFRKALAETKDPVYLKHIELAYIPVQFIILQNWKDWQKEGKLPGSLESYYKSLLQKAEKYDLRYNEARKHLKNLLPPLYRIAQLKNMEISVSKIYGSTPYSAFDGDPSTSARFGAYSGWLQVKFEQPKEIRNIELTFNPRSYSVTYGIKVSKDGKKWVDLIPQKTLVKEKVEKNFVCREQIKKTSVKYIRIHVYRTVGHNRKASWSGIYELKFY